MQVTLLSDWNGNEAGELIDVNGERAKALIAAGIAEVPAEKVSKPKTKKEKNANAGPGK